jgi:hypothetical protein
MKSGIWFQSRPCSEMKTHSQQSDNRIPIHKDFSLELDIQPDSQSNAKEILYRRSSLA